MHYSVIFLIGLIFGYLFERIHQKAPQISQIHKAIEEYTPNFFSSWYKTIRAIISIQLDGWYDDYIRKIKTSKLLTHDTYSIEYFHKGQKYQLVLKDTTKDRIAINVIDETGKDITRIFLEYLGPQYDFHQIEYTPVQLGYRKITIIDDELNSFDFHHDQVITLKVT